MLGHYDSQTNVEWFKEDLRCLLNSLYRNNLSFKYFANKKFFNFLKKKQSIYRLIEIHLYSYTNAMESTVAQVRPLKLADLSMLKIKSTLKYLDCDLINTLALPKHLNEALGRDLSAGLGKSYERAKMNKLFKISSKL